MRRAQAPSPGSSAAPRGADPQAGAAAGRGPRSPARSRPHAAPPSASRIERRLLGDGLWLVYAEHLAPQAVDQAVEHLGPEPALVLTYALDGSSTYLSDDGARLSFRAGHTTLVAHGPVRGWRQLPAATLVRQLRLVLDGPAIGRYLGEEQRRGWARRRGVCALAQGPTPVACRALLQPLLRPLWQPQAPIGPVAPLEAHLCALGLLAESLRPLAAALAPPAAASLRPAEAERLARAHALLHEVTDRVWTVNALAAAVGLHPVRLRTGFQQLYGCSPQQQWLALRMERSRALLQAGCRVSEVAHAVGYAHAANFSAAYRRWFGHPPRRPGAGPAAGSAG